MNTLRLCHVPFVRGHSHLSIWISIPPQLFSIPGPEGLEPRGEDYENRPGASLFYAASSSSSALASFRSAVSKPSVNQL